MQRANFKLKNKHKYQLTLLIAVPNFKPFFKFPRSCHHQGKNKEMILMLKF